MAPEEDPDDVVLAIDEIVADGADDGADDAEEAETEQPAHAQLAPDVHAHVPEEHDGDGDQEDVGYDV